jgi:O6-methylguanine-DNA--protein-cysteine methyltransferase
VIDIYQNSIDAFLSVLKERGCGRLGDGSVSEISVELDCLKNGIAHCSVQMLCNDGAGYRVDAYGDEAKELHGIAHEYSAMTRACKRNEIPIAVPLPAIGND